MEHFAKTNAYKNPSSAAGAQDALALLKADHDHVKAMFDDYENLDEGQTGAKKELADEICAQLTLHAEAEEDIFYPAVREASGEDDMVNEAVVEHASVKELIMQILSMNPGDELYDAKMAALREQIEHHVEEEEQEMFPKARQSGLDLVSLGAAIAERKDEASPSLRH